MKQKNSMRRTRYTYIASDNTATNGTALGADNQDIVVHQIIFGLGADGKYAQLYDKINPVTGATTGVVFKITQPTAGAGKDYFHVVDFGPDGLHLGEGGNVVTDASQVTVIWSEEA